MSVTENQSSFGLLYNRLRSARTLADVMRIARNPPHDHGLRRGQCVEVHTEPDTDEVGSVFLRSVADVVADWRYTSKQMQHVDFYASWVAVVHCHHDGECGGVTMIEVPEISTPGGVAHPRRD